MKEFLLNFRGRSSDACFQRKILRNSEDFFLNSSTSRPRQPRHYRDFHARQDVRAPKPPNKRPIFPPGHGGTKLRHVGSASILLNYPPGQELIRRSRGLINCPVPRVLHTYVRGLLGNGISGASLSAVWPANFINFAESPGVMHVMRRLTSPIGRPPRALSRPNLPARALIIARATSLPMNY